MTYKIKLITLLCTVLMLQGCAGGLIMIAGTAVAVSSDERTISKQIDDDNLSLAAVDAVSQLPLDHRYIHLNFVTNDSYLLVVGQVNNKTEKEMIGKQLTTLKDVKKVYNQLRISKPLTFVQKSKDSWITAQTKTKLTAHKDINSLQIKVVTENSEVFLIGLVKSKAADAATNIARKIAGVKHVHRVFQLIPEKAAKKI